MATLSAAAVREQIRRGGADTLYLLQEIGRAHV